MRAKRRLAILAAAQEIVAHIGPYERAVAAADDDAGIVKVLLSTRLAVRYEARRAASRGAEEIVCDKGADV
jgi:hypothetical protein